MWGSKGAMAPAGSKNKELKECFNLLKKKKKRDEIESLNTVKERERGAVVQIEGTPEPGARLTAQSLTRLWFRLKKLKKKKKN
jgi:hypothetical protein